jgi:tripartite-type tricarboxylate transporter receptor subunit TctC
MCARLYAAIAACAVLALSAAMSAPRAEEPYYKGKRVTVLINYAAGGPSDIEGRIFAKYLVKHIDGAPTLVVQNMDGAGGLVGAKYLGEVSARDGTVVGALTGAAWLYAANPERWPVPFPSYEFVARQPATTIHFVRKDLAPGMTQPSDIVKAQGLIAGGLSVDTSKDLRMRMVLDMLGVPFKYVTGYRSSPPARLALQRGEIHMFSESPPSYRTAVLPQVIEPGIAIPVWWDEITDPAPEITRKQMEGLAIPSFLQLYKSIKGTTPSGELWEAYRALYAMNSTLLRLVAMPPETPRPALVALRQAVERMARDPEYAAESIKTMGFVPEYETAPDMTQQVRAGMNVSPEMLSYIKEYTRNVPKR